MKIVSRCLGLAMLLGTFAVAAPPTAEAAIVDFPGGSVCLPPPGAHGFASQTAPFADGFVFDAGSSSYKLQDVIISSFSSCTPVPPGISNTPYNFDTTVFARVSVDGGPPHGVVAPHVPITFLVTQDSDSPLGYSFGATGPWFEKVANFLLPGGSTAQLRDSPTQLSSGHLTLEDLGTGRFEVTGFFDIFFELSLDDGATWIPASRPAIRLAFTDVVEPTTGSVLGLGVIALILRGRRPRT